MRLEGNRLGGNQGNNRPYQGEESLDERIRGMASEKPMLSVCGLAFLLAIVSLLFGVANIEVTEYGLNYSKVSRTVEPKTYTSGRYWIGPFNYFVRFPAVVKTIQFSDASLQYDLMSQNRPNEMLRSRTSDGLDVNIELSFQYQLLPNELFELYTKLGGAPDYHNLFVRIAVDILTETATLYSATEFFVERTKIGKKMETLLKEQFESRLYATIFSFQLRAVQLPSEFEEAIQETEVMKQDLQVAKAEQESTKVALETELMKATRRTKVRSSKASAEAQAIMLENRADIEQYTVTQHKAADSYALVSASLGGKEADVLEYIESRVIRDHPSALTAVGLATADGA